MNGTFFFLVLLLLFLLPFQTLNKKYIYSKPSTASLPPFWPPQCGAYPFFTCLLQTVDGNNNICPDCDSSMCTLLPRFPSNTFNNKVFCQPQTPFFPQPPFAMTFKHQTKNPYKSLFFFYRKLFADLQPKASPPTGVLV